MRDPPPISFIPTDPTKPFPMAALETAQAGLLPFTQLKRAQEDLTLRHLHHHQLQHHGQQKKQKMVSVINYGGGRSFDDDEEDDSWEVRAFAEDTNSAMGTTWPPRFYACSFCRREFRSAQALGGHMNVHRRDRARAHLQPQPPPSQAIISVAAAAPCFVFPAIAGGRGFPSAMDSSSSTLFSLSSAHASIAGQASDFSLLAKLGSSRTVSEERSADGETLVAEELDLELRLGW